MSLFRGKALRRNRFSKFVHFVISLAMVFNTSALGVFLTTATAQASQPPDVIFSDGFESGVFDQWTLSGSNWNIVNNSGGAHSGAKRAEINGPITDSALLKDVSTVGYQNIAVSYWYKVDSLEVGDQILVQWSVDGSNWTNLEDFTDGNENISNWTQKTYSLPPLADNQYGFKLRFSATLDAISNDTFKIDDISITGLAIMPPPPDPTFSFQETVDKTAVSSGGSVRYSIRASNSGPDAANGITITDVISPNFTITAVNCAGSGGAVCGVTSSANPVTVAGDLPVSSFFDVFIDLAVAPTAIEETVSNYASLGFGAIIFQSSPVNVIIDKTPPTTPIASPAGGDYKETQIVSMVSSDGGSGLKEIRYTTDGTAPALTSALYTVPIAIVKDTLVKAIAIDNAGNISEIMTAVYGVAAQISGQSISETSSNAVIIKWATDKPATSRVVYDTISRPTMGTAPNYGYAYSIQEQDINQKVVNHAVSLAGLTPGTTYYYRTISKASPEAVSAEGSFNTAPNTSPIANAHGPYEAILKDGKAEVNLVGTGTDMDGTIVKYEWDFEGDGIYDLAILPSGTTINGSTSHIYAKAGLYKAVLRVTDDKGATGTDKTTVNVLAHGPAALFNAGPDGLTISADGTLALFGTAADSLGNSWDATADTAFTVNDPCGKISGSTYLPCKAGEWEIQAAYQGLVDKLKIKVVAGELVFLEVSPYAKPFKTDQGKSQTFTANGFDADDNEVAILDPQWSVGGEKTVIGKIDQNGKFTATHGGIGRVTAAVGELSASVGVVVKAVEPAVAKPIAKKTKATGAIGAVAPAGEVSGGQEQTPAGGEENVASRPAGGEVAGEAAQACKTLPWWAWYLLAGFYAVFLIIYYMNLRRLDKENGLVRNWWVVPILLTAVMLGIYFLYRCPGVFLRWPWAMILIGVIISAVYYQSREPEDMMPAGTSGPSTPSDSNESGQIKTI